MDDVSGRRSTPGPALLFCPANRPDRFGKAAAAADVVILDLEDAVNRESKAAARDSVLAAPLDPDRTIIRLDPIGTPEHQPDLAMIRDTAYRMVMLAKTETPEEVASLAPLRVIALCETPRGVLAAPAIAAVPNTIGRVGGGGTRRRTRRVLRRGPRGPLPERRHARAGLSTPRRRKHGPCCSELGLSQHPGSWRSRCREQ